MAESFLRISIINGSINDTNYFLGFLKGGKFGGLLTMLVPGMTFIFKNNYYMRNLF
jgi:hypothetical protein